MLYLIHGDDIDAARKDLDLKKQKAKGKELREVNGKRLEESSLIQSLESSSLFGGDVFVIIENFLSSAKKREKSFTKNLDRILNAAKENDVILYEEKEMDKSMPIVTGKHLNRPELSNEKQIGRAHV